MRLQKKVRTRRHGSRPLEAPMCPEALPKTTIVVIGLLEMGYTDVATIAELLRIRDRRSVRRLLRMLKTTRNPVIRQCVDKGLPRGLCRPLPYQGTKVRCPTCQHMVTYAPCPRCSLLFKPPTLAVESEPDPFDDEAPPLAEAPTTALPGTRRKMAVMRRRFAAGQAIFHPHDEPYDEPE